MKPIVFHAQAILQTFTELLKGRFLLFFLPGLILTVIYYAANYYLATSERVLTVDLVDIGWIDWILLKMNSATNLAFSLMGMVLLQVYIFAVLTFLSPFNTQLSEQLDSQLTGKKFDSSWLRFFNDFFRMLFVVGLLLLCEFAFFMMYWMLSFIIGNAFLNELMYFLIAAFFFGFTFYDYPLERYGKSIFDTFSFSFSKPLLPLLTGSIFLLIYKIPYIGIPLSPVLATMIATIVYLYDSGNLSAQQPEKTTAE